MMKKSELEYIRQQAKEKFERIKGDWIDSGNLVLPHRTKWLQQQEEGKRNNHRQIDLTAKLALRSCVAGFLEGNTSASRPWARIGHEDEDLSNFGANKKWLESYTNRIMLGLSRSNFYLEAGSFYYDFNVYNTGTHYIEELPTGLYWHTLVPGSYYVVNGPRNEARVLVREFSMTVRALVEEYGVKKNGKYRWNNFSKYVKDMWDASNYNMKVDVVHVIKPNDEFNPNEDVAGRNRPWEQYHYEVGTAKSALSSGFGDPYMDPSVSELHPTFLRQGYNKRKPFIVGKSQSSNNFEYGETGPTLDLIGTIKSLNKKAISKDIGIEKLLEPTLQGPMNIKKAYLTNQPRGYIPMDANALAQGGLKPVNQIGTGWELLIQDVSDLRGMIDKFYYADFLMYLSRNPKTRTAAEVTAVVSEQQTVIGPQLQSLNFTYNQAVIDFMADWVLDNDPYLPPPPEDLQGQFLKTEFISVFAQAQKAADIPNIERYIAAMMNLGQVNPQIWQKVNMDKLADLYENRLYIPAGVNRPEAEVEKLRQQAQAQAQRQQMMTEAIPAMAGAAKDAASAQATMGAGGMQ